MAVTVVKVSDMTKKRKAGSPSQEGQSDINLGDLKEFIMMEKPKMLRTLKSQTRGDWLPLKTRFLLLWMP